MIRALNLTPYSLTLNHPAFSDAKASYVSWGDFAHLTSIDLQKCSLTSIPVGMSNLDPIILKTLRLEGNPLVGFHRTLVESKATVKDIIENLRETLRGEEVLKEMKVMVVGEPAVGKTTMLRVLYGHNTQELAAHPWMGLIWERSLWKDIG